MANDWDQYTVSELQKDGYLRVEDGNHGEYRPRSNEFVPDGVAFIRAADIQGGRVLFETASRINDVALSRIRKGVGAGGDVILSHKGTVGKLARVPLDVEPFVCSPQTTFWRSLNEDVIDRRYLYFYMQSSGFHQQLDSRKDETDMAPYVSLTAQRQLKLTLPPIGAQRAIAQILGALDDKIDLNWRMNRTLEATVEAVFNSWFVDFDPVVAKSEGRRPFGMDSATAALFPDAFADSEAGPRPRGWQVCQLGQVLELKRGYDLPTRLREAGSIPIYSSSGRSGSHNEAKVEGPGIVTGRYGTIGEVFFVDRPFWPLNTTLYVRDFKGNNVHFVYHVLSTVNFDAYVDKAAVPGVNRNDVHRELVVLPPKRLQEAFGALATKCREQVRTNTQQAESLDAIRDALLPRLLSGSLRVKSGEQVAEEAVR